MQAARGRRVAPGILVAPPGSKCNRTLRSSFKHPKPRGRKQDRIREKIFLAELTDYPVAKLEIYRIFDNDRYLFCHKSPLAAAPKGANTPKTLKCCNRFTHNAPSIGNLAQGRASVQLQYDNPAKSGFVCVWAPWWNSPPERWRSPRIGRQLLETGRYYGGSTTPTTTLATTALLLLLGILPVLRYYCYYCTALHLSFSCFLLWDSIIQGTVERIG